jgi:hypothetical protein
MLGLGCVDAFGYFWRQREQVGGGDCGDGWPNASDHGGARQSQSAARRSAVDGLEYV